MATTISSSSRPTAQMIIDALVPADHSFLATCTRDLASSNICTYNTHSTLWLVAAGVTFVAFTALAAGAFFYTGMFLPAYIPFAGIGALVFAMPVANLVKSFLEHSEASKKEAVKYQAIQDNFELQNKKTTLQLQSDLANRGITWHQIPGIQVGNPESLSKLNPILAQAMYLDDKIKKETELKQKFVDQARGFINVGFLQNRQEVYELRNAALAIEDRALHTKVHAAFVNAVLRKSNYNGALENVATISDVGYSERILGDALGDSASFNAFITFKNRNITPISYSDVKRMSVAELGQRLVAAMT